MTASANPALEPSLPERARTLAHLGRFGVLATHSSRHEGYPFASFVGYAPDRSGSPVLFLSNLAEHRRSLQSDGRASLLIQGAVYPLPARQWLQEVSGHPARLTLIGDVAEVDDSAIEAVRESYLQRHSDAQAWASFRDFRFLRLEVRWAYLVVGFGSMGWIEADAYAAAQPDPLADLATGILDHMNADHADALPLYCRAFASSTTDDAVMVDVDRLGMGLLARTDKGAERIRIAFPRPVQSSDEIRKVLIEMLGQARRA